MNILDALKQLRDDIKTWVANNLNDLNKRLTKSINNIPTFSGDYNDLTNAPDISEDDSGNMIIADESGNVIFKADAEGIHTTAVSLNGEAAATEKYVDDAIADMDVDFTGYATEDYVTSVVESAKEELSESIVAESDEWKVVDESGNIIFSVDASGAHTTELTLNGETAATESYVDDAIANIEFPTTDLTDYATIEYVDNAVGGIEIPDVDFTGYATETYVDNKVADLVNSAPEALNTLGELATALENHEDAYDALLETVGSKATKEELDNLKDEISESIVSETDEFHIVDDAGNIVASIDENGVTTTTVTAQNIIVNGDSVEEHIDNTSIHVTAAEKEVWNNKSNFSGSYNDLTDKPAVTDLSNYYTKTEVDAAIENVDVDLTGYATEQYVTTAISNIDIPEVDLDDYYTKTETDTAIESAKEELSESIVSESEEWHIVDNNGNIVATIDASGISTTAVATQAITLNGEVIDLSNYYTKVEINAKLGDIDATLDAILKMQEELMPKKPTFTIQLAIGGTETCTFEEGMTWSDWCNSEYNTIGAYVENDAWIDLNGRYIRTADSFEVSAWESITAGETYYA